jgi:hypothetical protein
VLAQNPDLSLHTSTGGESAPRNSIFAERCAMTPDQIPPDALFIQWGRFKAGASGRTAIIGLIGLIGIVIVVRLVGWL